MLLIASCLHTVFFAVVKLVALRLYRFAVGCGSQFSGARRLCKVHSLPHTIVLLSPINICSRGKEYFANNANTVCVRFVSSRRRTPYLCKDTAHVFLCLIKDNAIEWTHSLTSALNEGEWSASRPSSFTPRQRASSIHYMGWICTGTCLDVINKRKIPCSLLEFLSHLNRCLDIATFEYQQEVTFRHLRWTLFPITKISTSRLQFFGM